MSRETNRRLLKLEQGRKLRPELYVIRIAPGASHSEKRRLVAQVHELERRGGPEVLVFTRRSDRETAGMLANVGIQGGRR
jgi:hypothetical protein